MKKMKENVKKQILYQLYNAIASLLYHLFDYEELLRLFVHNLRLRV